MDLETEVLYPTHKHHRSSTGKILKTDPETAALNENKGLLKVNMCLRYCRVYTSGVKCYSFLGLATTLTLILKLYFARKQVSEQSL